MSQLGSRYAWNKWCCLRVPGLIARTIRWTSNCAHSSNLIFIRFFFVKSSSVEYPCERQHISGKEQKKCGNPMERKKQQPSKMAVIWCDSTMFQNVTFLYLLDYVPNVCALVCSYKTWKLLQLSCVAIFYRQSCEHVLFSAASPPVCHPTPAVCFRSCSPTPTPDGMGMGA